MFSALFACALAIGSALAVGPLGGTDKVSAANPMSPSSTAPGQIADVTKYPIISDGKIISFADMVARLEHADVVFLGEEHDDKSAHELELAVLQALYAHHANLALSMEMFERDVQPVLDEYLGDYITETHFLQASRPWPNYKTDYRPLVEFCREHHLPVLAANAPRRYVNMVSRKGPQSLAELPKESRGYLPRLPYSLELPATYDQELTALFGGQHDTPTTGQSAPANSMPSVTNLKAAQSLWDVSMADSLARFIRRTHRQVLQINGSMHSDHGYGIVYHLRQSAPHLKVIVVSVKPDADYLNPSVAKYANLADYVFVVPGKSGASL